MGELWVKGLIALEGLRVMGMRNTLTAGFALTSWSNPKP